MTQTRIAVAGAGLIGQAHMAVIQQNPACQLGAIVDPSPAATALAQRAGVPLYPTLEALLAHDRPDGIILATPNPLHLPQALQCIAAGLPILLEKPIATTVAEGRQLVDAVARSGARVLIVSSFWLGGAVGELHAATEATSKHGDKIERLSDISADLKNLIIHLNARSEIHDEQIRALQDAMKGSK